MTYVEKAWFNERRFVLEDDRVRFVGTQRFGSIVEQTIPLDTLQSEPARLRVRSTGFGIGCVWVLAAAIVLMVLFPLLGQMQKHDPEAWFRTMCIQIGVVLAGLAAYFLFPRRIEYATFVNRSGVAVLSIGRRGRHRAEFEPFVAEVARRIASLNRASDAGAAPDTTAR